MGAMLTVSIAVLLLLITAPGSGPGSEEPLAQAILAELNASRQRAGLDPVETHPALCTIARDQAVSVAATGGTASSSGYITSTTRRLYRAGYAAHSWTEGSLIATADADIPAQWRQARPVWWRDAETGDFEDIGIGVARYQDRPVVTIVLALKTRTVEWRQAAPLADLPGARALALAAVNELRLEHGREPVQSDDRLDAAAQLYAEDMFRRAYYDHTSPEGETVRDRVRAAGGAKARGLAENIAKGLFTPDEVVRRWANSPGHRRNILQRGATEVGLGVAFGENENGFEVVWVQIFASRVSR